MKSKSRFLKQKLPQVETKFAQKAHVKTTKKARSAALVSYSTIITRQKRQAVIMFPRAQITQQIPVTFLNVQQWEDDQELIRQKLQDKTTIKRELFMEDVLKSDDSVRFYTCVPFLSCLQMHSGLQRPEAEKLKYWDTNKRKTMAYHTSDKKKPLPKRVFKIEEGFCHDFCEVKTWVNGETTLGRHIFRLSITSQSYSHYLGVLSI